MGTIIQSYGPIYGESINGTVQGRPNGSVYTPPVNTISLIAGSTRLNISTSDGTTKVINGFAFSAESQDYANYVQLQMFADSACTTLLGSKNVSAGLFSANVIGTTTTFAQMPAADVPDIGDPVYLRAQLIAVDNTPVATSDVLDMERYS